MSSLRRAVTLLLTATMLAAGCGNDDAAPEDAPQEDPFEAVERAMPDPDAPERAAPRWEEVLTLSGEGTATEEFPIAEGALQWRARWTCESGSLDLELDVADEPLLEADCPGEGEAFAIETGYVELAIDGSGPWEVTVEQQVDTAHEEPPLEGMEDAEVVAEGEFFGVERRGEGTATLYRLADGSLALRFTDFQTVASPDLFVWVSEAEDPSTSERIFDAPHVNLGAITSTIGDQNYVLADVVDPDQVRSVVIWCAPLQIAYTAAVLER